jgi:hypothetical protein
MRHVLLAAALWLAWTGPALAQGGPETRLLYGFEEKAEIGELTRSSVSVALSREPDEVTQGKAALAVTFQAGAAWPGIQLRRRLGGWQDYDLFAFDVTNRSGKPVGLSFRFDDTKTKSYETRAHASKLLRPGRNEVAIALQSLRRENKAAFDVATLRRVIVFLGKPVEDVTLVFDNVRLEKEVAVEVGVPNAHLFDFSAEGGRGFPGFVKVIPGLRYDTRLGYGFVSIKRLRGSTDAFPDTLVADAVFHQTPEWGRTPFTFRVDLPDGRYRVGTVVTTPRFRDHSVTIAGREHKVAWTAKELFSEKGLYAGLHDDYHPGKDLWAAYVAPAWPWRWVEADVKGGRLDVTVSRASLAALAVYPTAHRKRMAEVLEKVEAARREHFRKESFLLVMPKPDAEPPAATPEQRRTGFMVFYPGRTDTVTCAAVPTKRTAGSGLTLAAARGQREPATVAVYPLRDANSFLASAPALTGPGGAVIPADRIRVHLVRHFIRKNGDGTWSPRPTQLIPPGGRLYRGFTRQLWITVAVPADAAAGKYEGVLTLAAGGTTQTVPVRLTVYPFTLPASSRASFACYYAGPMEQRHITRFDAPPLTFEVALDRQLVDMRRHGLNALQLPTPRITGMDRKAGRLRLDFDRLAVYVRRMKKRGFRTDYASQMFTIGLANRLKRMGTKEFSPRFNTVLKNTVVAIDTWFKERGVRILFWPVDEPREQALNPWNRNLADTLRTLKLYREVPGVRTTLTPMGDENGGVDYTPMVRWLDVIQTHPWPQSKKMMAIARAEGKPELWLYNAGVDRLSYGFYVWKAGAVGRWQWHYQWGDTSYNPFVGYHWAVAWPSPDGVVSSVGYEQIAMGIVDYRYVELLEDLIAKAKKAGMDTAAARRRLAEIRAGIPEWPAKGMGDGTDVGEAYAGGVNARLDGWRAAVAAEIVRLRAELDR